jgi:predicted nuclease of predicted toxin-antitoxin system
MTTEHPAEPRFLLDENLSHRHAEWLRSIVKDASAVVEIGLAGASDERVWDEAQSSNSVLVSLDAHFANLLRYPPEKSAGVIWLKLDPPTELSIRNALERMLNLPDSIRFRGLLFVVEETSIRIRGSI